MASALHCLLWAAAALATMARVEICLAESDASPWDGDARSAVRLIGGTTSKPVNGPVRAGIQIRLKAGWHTYWRYPGDAGVPPRFDFAQSTNVESISVLFPAPRRITEGGSVVLGYTDQAVFPIVVVPSDSSKAMRLHLKLDYAVCEKVCVPAEAALELALPPAPLPVSALIDAAVSRVPRKSGLNAGSNFAIRSLTVDASASRPRMIAEVAAPRGAPVDLFVEGPTPQWALPVPQAIASSPEGLHRFAFDLDGAPPGSGFSGTLVTLTAVAGDEAIEVNTALP